VDASAQTVAASPLVVPEIVALPEEIDIANAQQVGAELCTAFRPGVAVVIADMTRTTFCDSSGIRHLLVASDRAAATGAELRLAIGSTTVLRILGTTGVDQVLKIYPSLQAALTNASASQ
jgi:anti-sigma B factor antagonist